MPMHNVNVKSSVWISWISWISWIIIHEIHENAKVTFADDEHVTLQVREGIRRGQDGM